jgi:hypothetical protein
MDNTFSRLTLTAPKTSRGNLQRTLLKVFHEKWFRSLVMNQFIQSYNSWTNSVRKAGDSAQTPDALLDLIRDTLVGDFQDFSMIDGCPFNPVFDAKVDADFFTRRFPRGSTIYINPPFSDPAAFLLRCFILWAYFGLNVVLLIPTGKYQKL